MVLKCMWTTPSSDSLFNDHPFGTFDAGSGRRPPHQSRRFAAPFTTSALPSTADIPHWDDNFRKVPIPEVESLIRSPRPRGIELREEQRAQVS
jgi:hypothetical protein